MSGVIHTHVTHRSFPSVLESLANHFALLALPCREQLQSDRFDFLTPSGLFRRSHHAASDTRSVVRTVGCHGANIYLDVSCRPHVLNSDVVARARCHRTLFPLHEHHVRDVDRHVGMEDGKNQVEQSRNEKQIGHGASHPASPRTRSGLTLPVTLTRCCVQVREVLKETKGKSCIHRFRKVYETYLLFNERGEWNVPTAPMSPSSPCCGQHCGVVKAAISLTICVSQAPEKYGKKENTKGTAVLERYTAAITSERVGCDVLHLGFAPRAPVPDELLTA
jgi:hypothetical protein